MSESRLLLLDPEGITLAELLIASEEEGWFTGKVLSQNFPPPIKQALAWYDEVVQYQMLSYLDEASSAIERFGLRVKTSDDSTHRVYSLHIAEPDDVTFRMTPVPEPSDLRASD
jgi:hypothetical protein